MRKIFLLFCTLALVICFSSSGRAYSNDGDLKARVQTEIMRKRLRMLGKLPKNSDMSKNWVSGKNYETHKVLESNSCDTGWIFVNDHCERCDSSETFKVSESDCLKCNQYEELRVYDSQSGECKPK